MTEIEIGIPEIVGSPQILGRIHKLAELLDKSVEAQVNSMSFFQTRLFFRLIAKNREVYILKIVTLATAFACSTLILLFSLSEFGYDKFHRGHDSIFRILKKNNSEPHVGNRLSNVIPFNAFHALNSITSDSIIVARVKILDRINILTDNQLFRDSKIYTSDPEIIDIFSFDVLDGSLEKFNEIERTAILSSSAATKYFGSNQSAGKKLKIYSLHDTIRITVAAVYKDYPGNSHEKFNGFVRFDSSTIELLNFNPGEMAVYGKLVQGEKSFYEGRIKTNQSTDEWAFNLQRISEVYFGPRVLGEDSSHGDEYSILILVGITVLILFLALTSFINLTTLSLPNRSKELAVKKLAGTSQTNLMVTFAIESILVVGISLIVGVLLLASLSNWIESMLTIDILSMLLHGDRQLILVLVGSFLLVAISPLFLALRFTGAMPNRLLSSDTITFPGFKKTIMFLQLGISIFLIVASMVIRRQINYSLVKEPGRNHDQVVYVNYPKDLTSEGLANLRATWKKMNANVVDVMATSQLPDRISSKELDSEFYFMAVDRGFKDFFQLEMVEGNWFKANDGDSIIVVNGQGNRLLNGQANTGNVIGVFRDISGQFNQPEKPVKINVATYYSYNYLCIRILEVDIRKTVRFLESYFEKDGKKASVSFLNKRFEEWLTYQDRLNRLSEVLTIISALLSCFAVYGLSISIIRDKLKQIAIHKLCGADTFRITRLLIREFVYQLLIAIFFFGPITYMILKEALRNFVYATGFSWMDPIIPVAYCLIIIALLCGVQTLTLNRQDLSSALKG